MFLVTTHILVTQILLILFGLLATEKILSKKRGQTVSLTILLFYLFCSTYWQFTLKNYTVGYYLYSYLLI